MPHIDFVGPDGQRWPSATELTSLIPKDFLWSWYKRSVQKNGWQGWLANNALSQVGKETGTLVHYYLECLTQNQELDTEDKYNAKAIAQSLYNTVHPMIDEYVAIEPHLVSEEMRIHGTADIIVRRTCDTGVWIGDYKTSYQKDISHPIQLAIYSLCWNEQHGEQLCDKGFIARVDKKGKGLTVKIDEYLNLAQYYPVIRALRTLHDYTYNKVNKNV